jgi:dolichyl-phosphate beta-glucosyltransferase
MRPLSVVIPAFNEEARIGPTLERLAAVREVVVVDDGSRDRTYDVALAAARRHPSLRILRFSVNHGKGFAVRAGVLEAREPSVLVCDADLPTPLEDLDRMWSAYDAGCRVVIGSRTRPEEARRATGRRLIGRSFSFLQSILGVRGIRDTQCGFKLFEAGAAKEIFRRVRLSGFAYDVESLMLARRLGFRVAEVPVRWKEVDGSHIRPVRDGARMLFDLLRIRGWI